MAKARKYASRKAKGKTLTAPVWLVAAIIICGALFWLLDYYKILPYANLVAEVGLSDKPIISDSPFSVHYIDVEQGDSELIIAGDSAILIDGGEFDKGDEVLNYLEKQGIEELDYVIASHPHSDHIGGLPTVIDSMKVNNIILPNIPKAIIPTTQSYRNLLKAVKANNITVIPASANESYDLGGIATMKILAPLSDISENLNDYSVVIRVDYKQTSFLFAGDAEKQEENDILNSGTNIDVNVLKVGHHGSNTSSAKAFLHAVTPQFAVVELAAENSYGHPHKDAMKRLKMWTEHTYQTAINGNIVCSSDGTTVTFICERGE